MQQPAVVAPPRDYVRPPVKRPKVKGEDDATNGGTGSRSSKDNKKKLVAACNGCRKKKIKCSGDRPACSNCLRLNVPCEYPAVRNRGSRFGYTEMLQMRLEKLKKYVVDDAKSRLVPLDNADVAAGIAPYPGFNAADAQNNRRTSDPAEALSAVETTTSATATVPRWAAPAPAAIAQDEELPPPDIVHHLIELYFRNIHNQTYSLLHRETFMTRLRDGRVRKELILAMCGLAARYSRHPEVEAATKGPRYEAGDRFMLGARRLISQNFDHANLDTLQATIFMVQNEYFKRKGGRAMIYISMVVPMAQSLGLHKEPSPKLSWIEQEMCRRTFWSLIVLDRLAHSSVWYTIHIDGIHDVRLPAPEEYFVKGVPPPQPMPFYNESDSYKGPRSILSYHVDAVMLWNEVNYYLSTHPSKETLPPWLEGSRFSELARDIANFEARLPPEMRYARSRLSEIKDSVGMFVHVHSELNAAKFLLYSSVYPYVPRRAGAVGEQPPRDFIEKAATAVRESANQQATMIDDILTQEDIAVTPFVAFCTYTVSVAHIALSFSKDAQLALVAKQHLSVILRLLLDVRDYFYVAGVWCVLLKKRYLRKSERVAGTGGANAAEAFSRPGTPPIYLPEDLLKRNTGATGVTSPFDKSSSLAGSRVGSRVPSREGTRPSSPRPPAKRPREDTTPLDTAQQPPEIVLEPTVMTTSSTDALDQAAPGLDPSSSATGVQETEALPSNASTFGIDASEDLFFADTGTQWLNAFDLANDLVVNDFTVLENAIPDSQQPLQSAETANQRPTRLDYDVEREENILRHIFDEVVDVPLGQHV